MYFLHVVVDHQYHPWWYRHQYHPWWYRWHQPSDNALLTIPLVLVVVLFDDECFVIYCWLNYYLWFSGLLLPLHWFRTYFQHVNIPLSLCSWCVLVLLWFYNIVSTNYNCILVYSFELLCLRYNLNCMLVTFVDIWTYVMLWIACVSGCTANKCTFRSTCIFYDPIMLSPLTIIVSLYIPKNCCVYVIISTCMFGTFIDVWKCVMMWVDCICGDCFLQCNTWQKSVDWLCVMCLTTNICCYPNCKEIVWGRRKRMRWFGSLWLYCL